jgi:hypothetical protein
MAPKHTIAGEEHGKGTFSTTLSAIVKNHRAGARIIGKPADFVLEACRLTDQWSTVAYRPDTEVRVANQQVGPRKVKMLVLRTTSEKDGKRHDVLLPKQKLVDALFPAKKREATNTPENAHYGKVRGAMRLAIQFQMQNARAKIQYPCECCVTGKIIRRGIKVDLDHHGTCFAELCDEWLRFEGLKYTDVVLAGPPNAKRFKDPDLQKSWADFHFQRAILLPALASANRSKGSEDYATPVDLIGTFKAESSEDMDLDW